MSRVMEDFQKLAPERLGGGVRPVAPISFAGNVHVRLQVPFMANVGCGAFTSLLHNKLQTAIKCIQIHTDATFLLSG